MTNFTKENCWSVYIHIIPQSILNLNHDRYYVGITSRCPSQRWNNGNGYKTQRFFFNAIQKYGWNNIEHHIVAENLNKDEACNMEISLIEKLKSNNKNGE